MLSGAPYRADIWQLGTIFKSTFGVFVRSHVFLSLTSKYLSASWASFSATHGFVRHYVLLSSGFSSFGASASKALHCVRRLVLSHEILMSDVPRPVPVVYETA